MKALVFSALALASLTCLAQTTTVVAPANMKGWTFFDDGAGGPCLPGSACEMVNGPATPPAGTGSARLTVSSTSHRPLLGALLEPLAGKRLADITTLSYATYKTDPALASDVLAIALQFPVDNDVTDADYAFRGRLVFEPYHEPSLGPVQPGVWQTWNALLGKWWLSGAGNPTRFPSPACGQGSPCTISQLTSLLSQHRHP